MSRYTIVSQQPNYTCVVGYDPPLGTFFAQVRTNQRRRQFQELLWVGTTVQEILSVSALAQAIAEYAIIPVDICQQLETDQRTHGFRPRLGTMLMHLVNIQIEEASS